MALRYWAGVVLATVVLGWTTSTYADCADDKLYGPENAKLTAGIAKPISGNEQKTSKTLNGIFFTSDYDNGSLDDITTGSGTDVYNGTLFTEDSAQGLGGSTYQFRFRMYGTAGRTITLNLTHTRNPYPFISYDGKTFRRMTAAEAPSTSQMVVTCDATQDFVEVAFFDPLGYQEIHDRVNAIVSQCSDATTEVLGKSRQNRDLWMVTVTDRRYPDAGKRRVWMHARVHAGEVTATWSMLGFLTQITANTTMGQLLRRHCIFTVVPVVNADGVHLGLTRWDSAGFDLERWWGAEPKPPEVQLLKTKVDQFMASANPIEIALNMHSTVGLYDDSFFFKHITGTNCGVTANFEVIQQFYIDSLDQATPRFDNLDPQTSCLNPTIFIESYFWNNWQELVMAMTHEGHYYFQTGSNGTVYNTGADYFEVGRGMAEAAIQYFGLLPLAPELAVIGNGSTIPAGASGPSTSNGTDFGTVVQGSGPRESQFALFNGGNAIVDITNIEITGPNAADFSVDKSSLSLLPGTSDTLTIAFNGTELGEHLATVVLTSNATTATQYSFAIKATVNACRTNTECFVEQLYNDFLQRPSEPVGFEYWTGQICKESTPPLERISYGFLLSSEFSRKVGYAAAMYFALLNDNVETSVGAANYWRPDYDGLHYWAQTLLNNAGPTGVDGQTTVTQWFLQSPEVQARLGSATPEAFVAALYRGAFGRVATAEEVATWAPQAATVEGRAQLVVFFLTNPESQNFLRSRVIASMMYLGFLGRTSDPAGFAYHTERIDSGITAEETIGGFLRSPEYSDRLGVGGCGLP